MAIFVFPSLAFSQGLKLDLLDGNECRLFCDSTRQGLVLGQDSASLLPTSNFLRTYHAIDDQNLLLASEGYYFNQNEVNKNGQYRVFGLSDAALSRSETRGRSEWAGTKRAALGKPPASARGTGGLLDFDIPVKFPKALASLVGEGGPGLAVTGNYKVIFKVDKNYTTGITNVGQNRQGTPGFQTLQEYNMFITGNVGSKLFVNMKTDKRANVYNQRLDLADRIQIRYKGNEEDLVQTIEAGNTTLALGGTRFAGYSQSVQGLFGLKAQGKLGGVNWTAITSQQKGNSQSKSFRAGAEATTVPIREKEFLHYTYFDLGRKRIAKPEAGEGLAAFTDEFDYDRSDGVWDSLVGDPVFLRAATTSGNESSNLPRGDCFVDPLDTTVGAKDEGNFKPFNWDEYELNRDSFYVRFKYPLSQSDIVGVALEVYRGATGRIDTIGYGYWPPNVDTSIFSNKRYVLKLIKHSSYSNAGLHSYYYEWKNVYDLRERDIDPDGFTVSIYKGAIGTEANANRQNKDYQDPSGVKYIRLLGLDRYQKYGEPGFDNAVDLNRTVVDLDRGYLIFPERYPFNSTVNFTGDTADYLSERVPAVYSGNLQAANEASKYYIEIQTKSRRTFFSLGQVDIMEHSEDVRLNGRQLVRNVDYNIDYQLGTINFLGSQVTDPNADLQINYEYTPFLSATKKNLFGFRTEYAPSEQFRLGSTVLYRNASTIDQKPRIGEEPSTALLFDTDFGYTGQSNLLTRLVDQLPGVTAVAPSAFQLDAEIARSMPNPNTLGRAYIDDFEGSRDFLSLGIRRAIWTKSSAPAGKNQPNRGRLAWYVPDSKITDPRNNGLAVERFRVLEVFPDRSVPSIDERMDVLELRYFPKADSSGADTASWAGMMRWLSPGLQNHQETRLLEFWVGLEEGVAAPKLRFDFGQITEDINGDGVWQTEDSARIGTVVPEKDIGLDLLADANEPGYGSGNPDPSGDDWGTDIDHINGTDGNRNDPEWLSRPDNEDLTIPSNGALGIDQDSYFSLAVDISDTSRFLVPGSLHPNADGIRKNESRLIRWRQIRVPLKDTSVAKTVGVNPSWSTIQFARIWLEGTDTARILFASLEMVGNRWKELGVFDDSLVADSSGSQKVRVSVINSQEHPAYQADPPPGVSEVLNRVTNLREREQSLVLTYENIRPKNRGLLQRVLLGGAEDYSGYRTLKMLVHGDAQIGNPADTLSDSLLFFMRFGSGNQNDPNNFYEYRVLLKRGWDANNFVNLDFNRLTNLKNVLNTSRREAGITTGVGDTTDGNYRVRGNPSLAAVRWYVLGVQNLDPVRPAAGEVWTDELLLSDVRRETGTAARFHVSTQLSDLGSVNFEVSRTGATFRNLTGNESGTLSYNRAASTNELLNVSGNFQAHRFLPRFLGVTAMPISLNWSRSRSTPRLRTNSDIVLTDEFAAEERSEVLRRGISISPVLRKESKSWLRNWTLNRIGTSFTYSYGRSSDPFTRLSEQRSYTAGVSYNLSPPKPLGFKPFGWLPSFWLLKRVEGTQFSPVPITFNVSGDVARTQTVTILNDLRGSRSGSYVRDFRGRLTSGFRIFPNLTADYNFSTRRDISNPDNLVFSASPRKFKLGLEVERNQDFHANYNPGLLRFADTRLSFNSTYREAGGFASSSDGTRRIEASNGYGANVNFNLTRFFGEPRPPSAAEIAKQAEKQAKKAAEAAKMEAEKKRAEEEKKAAENRLLDSARTADSLARAARTADSLKAAALDRIPDEIRMRESLERFFPLPVPVLGFVLPRLGPEPEKLDSGAIVQTPERAVNEPEARPDSASKIAGETPAPGTGAPPADTVKKPTAPPITFEGQGKGKGLQIGRIFLLSDGLELVRKLAQRVDPVQFTYNHTDNISRQGLRKRPPLAFQFGLSDDPGEGGRSGTSDGTRESDNYVVGSGLNLGSGIRTTTRYAKNTARAVSSSGSSRQEAQTFPDVTLTVSGLEQRVGFLKKILPAGSMSSGYQRQKTTVFDVAQNRPNTIGTTKSHNPLISVSSTFFRGLSANFSHRKSTQKSQTRGLGEAFVVTETKEKAFLFSTRYSFIAPRGIRLPLLSGIRLSSSLNTTLAVEYTRRVSRGQSGVTYDGSNLRIGPAMTYSFSTQVDGGLNVQWTDQKDNIARRTTKVRSVIFSVDLKF